MHVTGPWPLPPTLSQSVSGVGVAVKLDLATVWERDGAEASRRSDEGHLALRGGRDGSMRVDSDSGFFFSGQPHQSDRGDAAIEC